MDTQQFAKTHNSLNAAYLTDIRQTPYFLGQNFGANTIVLYLLTFLHSSLP